MPYGNGILLAAVESQVGLRNRLQLRFRQKHFAASRGLLGRRVDRATIAFFFLKSQHVWTKTRRVLLRQRIVVGGQESAVQGTRELGNPIGLP